MFLTECSRDAMQGWKEHIPTQQKIDYLNALMRVGFDVLDCASFVSAKAVPQMADSAEVVDAIEKNGSRTLLSVVVANVQGAEMALQHPNIDILGFPFSVSETFQQRNTNKSRAAAYEEIVKIKTLTDAAGKRLFVYLSMAFGNPYSDAFSVGEVEHWAGKFAELGVKDILLSDTTGVGDLDIITTLFQKLPGAFPGISFGAHFHNRYEDSYKKLKAAYDAGCRRFDSAIKGIGGCPMAKDELVGNMPTEQVINFLATENEQSKLNLLEFESAYNRAKDIFKF